MPTQVEGTVAQNGICLGDISGDGNHELIVGNEAGELFIFKVFENEKSFIFWFVAWLHTSCLSSKLPTWRVQGWCHGYAALISASSPPLVLVTSLDLVTGINWFQFVALVFTLKILNLFSLCSVLVVASGCGWLNIFDLSEELSPLEGEPPRHILPLHTQVRGQNIKLW